MAELDAQRAGRRSEAQDVPSQKILFESMPGAQKGRRPFGRTSGRPQGEGQRPESIIAAIHE